MSYATIKTTIPLHSDLASLILKFLEPCIDYEVPKCIHIKCLGCDHHVGEVRLAGNCTVNDCKNCEFLSLSERDYKTINDFIDERAKEFMTSKTVTLYELFDFVGNEFGTILDAIQGAMAPCESRSNIRTVCCRVAEFLDGSLIKTMHVRNTKVRPRLNREEDEFEEPFLEVSSQYLPVFDDLW